MNVKSLLMCLETVKNILTKYFSHEEICINMLRIVNALIILKVTKTHI